MANYIGKIAAVGTINMSQIASGLNASARDVDKYAKSVRSTIVAANSAASSSFSGLLTPIQKLEQALAAASTKKLDLKVGGRVGEDFDRIAERIRVLVGAATDVAKPLKRSQDSFVQLSAVVQNEFIGAMTRAQTAAGLLERAIDKGQIRNTEGYQRLKRVVDDVIASQQRLSEAQALASPLATGRELRFNRPDLANELQRAAASQTALTPQVIASSGRSEGVAAARNLVELQQRQTAEALRLQAVLETIRNTRAGDTAAIEQANAELTRQLRILSQTTTEVEGFSAAASIRTLASRAEDAANRRARGSFGSLADAERGAEQLFSRIGQLGPKAFRQLSDEIERLASAFGTGFLGPVNDDFKRLLSRFQELEAATRKFTLAQQAPQARGLGLFGAQTGSDAEQAIARARQVSAEFDKLPDAARAGLSGLAGIASRVADQVAAGTSNATALNKVLDRLQENIKQVNAAATDRQRRSEVATAFLPPVIDPPPSEDQVRRQRTLDARREIGLDQRPEQGLDRLGASIARARENIQALPAPLQQQFLPALARADDLFVQMRRSGRATADQIAAGARAMATLGREVERAQRASALFGGSFAEFAQDRSASVASARFQTLRSILLATGQTAGSAVQAVDELGDVLQRAASTAGGFKVLAAEIRNAEAAAVNQVAAAAGQSPRAVGRRLDAAGDISTKRFQNLGLAAQQAAFAFEDFFSVTGGLDQRIRAAGNNISQLGFVLGGTTGLVAGIAAAVGSQAVVGLYKFINAGRETRDEVKALNDLFSQQKTIVESLAASFEQLADAVAGRALSGAAKEARDFAKELDGIRKRQAELRDNRAFALDEDVLRARADVNVASRRVEEARTRDQGVAAQRELDAARERLRQEEEQNRRRRREPPRQPEQRAIDALERRIVDPNEAAARAAAAGGGAGAAQGARQIAQQQNEAIRRLQQQVREAVAPGFDAGNIGQTIQNLRTLQAGADGRGDQQLAAEIAALITQLRGPLARAADESAIKLSETTDALSRGIDNVRERALQLSDAGLSQASDVFTRALDELGSQVVEAQNKLADAFEIEDEEARQKAIAAAQAELDARKQAIDQQLQSTSAVVFALDLFADALERAASVVQSDLEASRSDAEQARRRDLQFSTPETQRSRQAADDRFRQQRDAARQAERDIEIERTRLQERLGAAGVGLGVQDPLGRLDQIQQQLAGGRLTNDQREGLVRERERLQAAINPIIEAFDLAAQAITQGAEQLRERNELAAEGDELLRSAAEREASRLAREFEAIRLSFQQERNRAQQAGQAVDPARLQAAQAQSLTASVERIGPLLAQFAAEVKNAVLTGPSRSAIQASDVSTVEGNRERIRVVQADDPNRNADLVELRRQTKALEELLALAREQGVVIAQ